MKALIGALSAALLLLAFGASAGAPEQGRPRSIPTNMELLEELAREIVDKSLGDIALEPGDVVLVRCVEDHAIAWVVEDYLAARLAALGASVYLAPRPPQKAAGEAGASDATSKETPKKRRPASGDTTRTGPMSLSDSEEDVILTPGRPDTGSAAKTPAESPDEPGLAGSPDSSGVSMPRGGGVAETASKEGDAGVELQTVVGPAPAPDKVLDFRVGDLEVNYTRRWRKSLFGSAMVERTARAALFFRLLDGKDGRVMWSGSDRRDKRDIVPQKMLSDLEDVPGQAGSQGTAGGGLVRVVEPIVVSGIVVGLVFLFYSSRT